MSDDDGRALVPIVPPEEIDDYNADVRSSVVEENTEKKSSNPVDETLAEELSGFIPDDWSAKTYLEDADERKQYMEVTGYIRRLQHYGVDFADIMEAEVDHSKKLSVSVEGRMLKVLQAVLESFGAGRSGGGSEEGKGGVRMFLERDLTREDDD